MEKVTLTILTDGIFHKCEYWLDFWFFFHHNCHPPQTFAANAACCRHLLVVNDTLAYSNRSISIPLLLLDNHISKLHRKVLLCFSTFGTERVNIRLTEDPDLQLLVIALHHAGHPEVGDGQAELELVAHARLLRELLAEDQLVVVEQKVSDLLLVPEDVAPCLVLCQH